MNPTPPSQIGAMYKGDRSRKETLVEFGFRLPSALDNRPLRFEEGVAGAPGCVRVGNTGPYEQEHAGRTVEQVVRPTGLVDPRWRCGLPPPRSTTCSRRYMSPSSAWERVLVTTLTKRMSEDLTEYLADNGIRALPALGYRYRGAGGNHPRPAPGEFDVLVGINLLREGLDMPEVSLVAILDADKEGFLRPSAR